MGELNGKYGSELHLLRWLGRHRNHLNTLVGEATGSEQVAWLDMPFHKKPSLLDADWQGLDFLEPDDALNRAWKDFWPQVGNTQNWDAIARGQRDGKPEWILVEAKSHLNELVTSCNASEQTGRDHIARSLNLVKQDLDVDHEANWLKGYYQYANRLAMLQFLRRQGIEARLLFIYFTGDLSGHRRSCPQSEDEWREPLARQNEHLGLPESHVLSDRVHTLFLPVWQAWQPSI